jgi:hypothetical protein
VLDLFGVQVLLPLVLQVALVFPLVLQLLLVHAQG